MQNHSNFWSLILFGDKITSLFPTDKSLPIKRHISGYIRQRMATVEIKERLTKCVKVSVEIPGTVRDVQLAEHHFPL